MGASRLKAGYHRDGDTLIYSETYGYDAPGNPTRIVHSGLDTTTAVWDVQAECFDYDSRQRLSHAYTFNGGTPCATPNTTVRG